MARYADDTRVVDYFVLAGLPEEPEPLEARSEELHHLKSPHSQAPIVDLHVIFRSLGEATPKDFTCLDTTPTGYIADLNHGTMRCPEVFLCYRRGRDKPPLTDIGLLYEGKDRLLPECEVIKNTPCGRSANVNNSTNARTFVTYRRASETMPCNELVVTDIAVIIASKGEEPPHAFCKIPKSLNKSVVGSDVFLCYKKSVNKAPSLTYKPGLLSRYPLEDWTDFPLPEYVALFCLPMGACIESWPAKVANPAPVFSPFVLNVVDDQKVRGLVTEVEKVYGAAVTFYESFSEKHLTAEQAKALHTEKPQERKLHYNKCICVLSHWPFFNTFEKFLLHLHKLSTTGPHTVPIERYISHLIHEVPFPKPERPRILIHMNQDEHISLQQLEDSPLPLSGGSFKELLVNLGPDTCLTLLSYALTEQKLLLHSLRPNVLTSVCEAVAMMIFPFHWQCPYIPMCPLGLSDILLAPMAFLIGVDSRYFDLYDPPDDVICLDLDTNSLKICDSKKVLYHKLLPKKQAKNLRNTLQTLYERCIRNQPDNNQNTSAIDSPEKDFRAEKKERAIELEIQEAFLRFMVGILKGYRAFLLPITKAPTIGATDPEALFQHTAFQKSRDRSYQKFFTLITKTQMFIRFIEERSFVSSKDASLAFFDECTERAESEESSELRWLESDHHHSDRTVFVMPPEPLGLPPSATYSYTSFEALNHDLFHKKAPLTAIPPHLRASNQGIPGSPLMVARRTKHELKISHKAARKHSETPLSWSKCLVGCCYSLWFTHLPSYVQVSQSKASALRTGIEVLLQSQKLNLKPADEVNYRILMQLCGQYGMPVLAVKVLFEMRNCGIQPNAITYGYYNKAVLEATWPSDTTSSSQLLWNKLRNLVKGVAQFRRHGEQNRAKRMSLSIEEVDHIGSDADHISADSLPLSDSKTTITTDTTKAEDIGSTGTQHSDMGYSSYTEVQKGGSNQQLDVTEDSKVEARSDPVERSARRSLQFDKMDFSEADAFRSRVGSIIKNSTVTLIHEMQGDPAVESSAGVLMTSTIEGENVTEAETKANVGRSRRRHKSMGDYRSSFKSSRHTPVVSPITPTIARKDDVPSEKSSEFPGKDSIKSEISGKDDIKSEIPGKDDVKSETVSDNAATETIKENTLSKKLPSDNKDTPVVSEDVQRNRAQSDVTPNIFSFPDRNKLPSLFRRTKDESFDGLKRTASLSGDNQSPGVQDNKTMTSDKLPDSKSMENLDSETPKRVPSKSGRFSNLGAKVSKFGSEFLERTGSKIYKRSMEELLDTPEDSKKKPEQLPSKLEPGQRSPNIPIRSPGSSCLSSPLRTPVTHNDPLGALADDEELVVPCEGPTASTTTVLNSVSSSLVSNAGSNSRASSVELSSSLSPSKDHLDVFSADIDDEVEDERPLSRMGRSNTFTERSTPLDKDEIPVGSERSATLPREGRSVEPVRMGISPAPSSTGSSFSLGSSFRFPSFGSGNMNPLVGASLNHLKSGITTLGKKYTEIREAIATGNTPIKGLGSSLDLDGSDWPSIFPNSRRSSAAIDYISPLRPSPYMMQRTEDLLDHPLPGDLSHHGSTQSLGDMVQQVLPVDIAGSHAASTHVHPTAVEVTMTSCCRCHSCQCLLYDEDIMAGWTAEDHNLNTRCAFCSQPAVPYLSITVTDYRDNVMPGHEGKLCTPKGSTDNLTTTNEDDKNEADGTFTDPLTALSEQPKCEESSKLRLCAPRVMEQTPVCYLSPMVLRKELERVLEQEGDTSLTDAKFVDEHTGLYWNLLWFYKRLYVPSYLPGLILSADIVNSEHKAHCSWEKATWQNVSVRCMWDNHKFFEELGQPLYIQHMQKSATSPLVQAIVTEDRSVSKQIMKQIRAGVQCNDLFTPLKLLCQESRKRQGSGGNKQQTLRRHSLYREILFLAIVSVGTKTIDHAAFDREYRRAYSKLTDRPGETHLLPHDTPPTPNAFFCRRIFGQLQL